MTLRRPSSSNRWALWAFALALLLKAAMPMLASASAQAQGKAVVEVCTVYGVSLVPLDPEAPAPLDHTADHGAEHCALNALPALAALDAPPAVLPAAAVPVHAAPRQAAAAAPHDASARWVAGLHHGPPTFA